MNRTKSLLYPILLLGILFFVFGFVTWLNGALIPYLKLACELNNFQSMLVAFAFYIAYFFMALPSSWVLSKTGLKSGMMLGLLVMSLGAICFIPAAITRNYFIFLAGLFIIGTGLSLLQTASNPYITILGPIESAARRISIMGICNKVAGVIAPIVLGMVVLSDADLLVRELENMEITQKALRLNELAKRVITPYSIMAGILALLALFVRVAPLPEIQQEETETKSSDEQISFWGIRKYPHALLGVLALFLYVGAEVIAGDTIGTFGQHLGIPLSEAKNFTSYTLIFMVIGYVIGILTIPRFISQEKALTYSAICGLIFSMLIILTKGYTSIFFLAALGLSNALVWPAIWPLAIHKTGAHLRTASALLIMAIAGGAILPLIYGALADLSSIGPTNAYAILLPCYSFILYYSIKGYKIPIRKN